MHSPCAVSQRPPVICAVFNSSFFNDWNPCTRTDDRQIICESCVLGQRQRCARAPRLPAPARGRPMPARLAALNTLPSLHATAACDYTRLATPRALPGTACSGRWCAGTVALNAMAQHMLVITYAQ